MGNNPLHICDWQAEGNARYRVHGFQFFADVQGYPHRDGWTYEVTYCNNPAVDSGLIESWCERNIQ